MVVRSQWSLSAILLGLVVTEVSHATAADPPCDKYPPVKQQRCTEIWNELNKEDGNWATYHAKLGWALENIATMPHMMDPPYEIVAQARSWVRR